MLMFLNTIKYTLELQDKGYAIKDLVLSSVRGIRRSFARSLIQTARQTIHLLF